MSIDLTCYSSTEVNETNALLQKITIEHSWLFPHEYLLRSAELLTAFDEELATEFNFSPANSTFRIHLNNKSSEFGITKMADLLREYFGRERVLVLFEYDEPI
ncbi:hypothetical protein [Desulfovibrio cuneatus]|uniref:hypothetical protein n=1 Tax=Desulfovibrio cuneatus TaxID=159728 RepID=UPI000485A888|nr:hypothetical protein [Desulfovibrio cuneatus]